jgi:hypothetical protein
MINPVVLLLKHMFAYVRGVDLTRRRWTRKRKRGKGDNAVRVIGWLDRLENAIPNGGEETKVGMGMKVVADVKGGRWKPFTQLRRAQSVGEGIDPEVTKKSKREIERRESNNRPDTGVEPERRDSGENHNPHGAESNCLNGVKGKQRRRLGIGIAVMKFVHPRIDKRVVGNAMANVHCGVKKQRKAHYLGKHEKVEPITCRDSPMLQQCQPGYGHGGVQQHSNRAKNALIAPRARYLGSNPSTGPPFRSNAPESERAGKNDDVLHQRQTNKRHHRAIGEPLGQWNMWHRISVDRKIA